MTHMLKVLIVDPDQFFVSGLQQLMIKHFQAKGIAVSFMNNQLSYPMADLIIWAPGYPTTLMPTGLLARNVHMAPLIIIMSRQITHLSTHTMPWVFHRHECHSILLALIDQALISSVIAKKREGRSQQLENDYTLLSQRQREVIRYVLKGMCLNEIADKLQIHIKTVSSHKRAAMVKLQLNRTAELYNWFIRNPMP
ncbi:helix-turn-helix transcriptional regulator [Serratia fonticola]|uniref:helix-turn-helix transcriptional regulator n=1 Tax=Serratia fonticola TaxID=47917 RepID=UPI0021772FCC|nr:LuxR C-terminal-related transcriptional regulator [Serratia fonticola]CAI0999456.1 Capsular synthesis regulator component B [Serratia fonticola]CAI1193190.1 Capsular synthesis regulator component B [Serratia fonticola]CAI1965480.1 Capsular synthesis regulator component B [Serratia fonticola]CAI2002515.1 Capsular synthesis regulator component B [Serratia fonticola]